MPCVRIFFCHWSELYSFLSKLVQKCMHVSATFSDERPGKMSGHSGLLLQMGPTDDVVWKNFDNRVALPYLRVFYSRLITTEYRNGECALTNRDSMHPGGYGPVDSIKRTPTGSKLIRRYGQSFVIRDWTNLITGLVAFRRLEWKRRRRWTF